MIKSGASWFYLPGSRKVRDAKNNLLLPQPSDHIVDICEPRPFTQKSGWPDWLYNQQDE